MIVTSPNPTLRPFFRERLRSAQKSVSRRTPCHSAVKIPFFRKPTPNRVKIVRIAPKSSAWMQAPARRVSTLKGIFSNNPGTQLIKGTTPAFTKMPASIKRQTKRSNPSLPFFNSWSSTPPTAKVSVLAKRNKKKVPVSTMAEPQKEAKM